jgi:hypothetical protein
LIVDTSLIVCASLLVGSFLIFGPPLIGVTPRISGLACRALWSWRPWRLARRLASGDK